MFRNRSKTAGRLLLLIFLLAAGSLAAIFIRAFGFFTKNDGKVLIADLYQDGALLTSINLTAVTESYTFSVNAPGGGSNLVEVRPGEIGIREADCPDRICVRQGYIHTSLLPITCLPHRLVIQLRTDNTDQIDTEVPDAVVR